MEARKEMRGKHIGRKEKGGDNYRNKRTKEKMRVGKVLIAGAELAVRHVSQQHSQSESAPSI